jgi:hypothetical protein
MSQPITAVTIKALCAFSDPNKLELELLGVPIALAGEASVGEILSLLGAEEG